MLNTAVKVLEKSGIEGAGLVADRFITAGEIIFQYDKSAPPAHLHEFFNWPRRKKAGFLNFAIQLGNDEWCFRQGDIRFMNHSCDPNVWWEGYGTMVARRDINRGEELSFDYSTSEITLTWDMECRCGSDSCRGVATNRDYLDTKFQKTYAGHLPAHVVEAIKRSKQGGSNIVRGEDSQLPESLVEAINKANLNEAEFREKYGDQYIIEMVRRLMKH